MFASLFAATTIYTMFNEGFSNWQSVWTSMANFPADCDAVAGAFGCCCKDGNGEADRIFGRRPIGRQSGWRASRPLLP